MLPFKGSASPDKSILLGILTRLSQLFLKLNFNPAKQENETLSNGGVLGARKKLNQALKKLNLNTKKGNREELFIYSA